MKKDVKANGNINNKLPFAIFVSPKEKSKEMVDFKEVFTEIISDRIKENLK